MNMNTSSTVRPLPPPGPAEQEIMALCDDIETLCSIYATVERDA